MKDFCRALCCCCCLSKNKADQPNVNQNPLIPESDQISTIVDDYNHNVSAEENKERLSKQIIIEDDSSYSEKCFEDNWVRDEEKISITYTKRAIINILENEFISDEGYVQLHNKDNMILSVKNAGSIVSDKFQMIRMFYFIPKAELPSKLTVEDFGSYISSPEKRRSWDTAMNEYRFLEGNEFRGIVYLWMKSQAIVISQRDMVEKIFSFKSSHGIYYSFSSSVDDKFIPVVEDVVRVVDWCSCYSISEDETNFYFKTLTQLDYKMVTPQFVLQITLPTKLKEWYKLMKAKINVDFQEKEKDTEVVEKEIKIDN